MADLRPPPIDTGSHREDSWYSLDPISPTSPAPALPDLSPIPPPTVLLPDSELLPPPTDISPLPVRPNTSRFRSESRKLLSHVLTQLQGRTRPPLIYDAFASPNSDTVDGRLSSLVGSVKDAVRLRNSRQAQKTASQTVNLEDSDAEAEQEFSTDDTFNLLLQLKDVLSMSVAQGWRIFDEGPAPQESGDQFDYRSPFRTSRHSSYTRRSRSVSPGRYHSHELLQLCLSVLTSIASEDCRFRMSLSRPTRPPHSLQLLLLNIAQFLVHYHRHDPSVTVQVGFSLLPAFSTFPRAMHIRLLSFFETSIIRRSLETLLHLQGIQNDRTSNLVDEYDNTQEPAISIQVDEVQDDIQLPNSRSMSRFVNVQSTSAPLQSSLVYQISSLVSALLSSILQNIDVEYDAMIPRKTDTWYYLIRLLRYILDFKIDSCMDLLQVVANCGRKAARTAIGLLLLLQPTSIGHVVIGNSIISPEIGLSVLSSKTSVRHHGLHHFVAWKFRRVENLRCRCCTQLINGFGLLCSLCMCGVHFDCYDYPAGNHIVEYTLSPESHIQNVAVYRYSIVQNPGSELTMFETQHSHSHSFEVVNVFTLCLCVVCHKPLWGLMEQGAKCSSCPIIAHFECLPRTTDILCSTFSLKPDDIEIDHATLRSTCLIFYAGLLTSSKDVFNAFSFEELSIIEGIFSVQIQILLNAIALGTIRISENKAYPKRVNEEFELHVVHKMLNDLLSSNQAPFSDATADYLKENNLKNDELSVLFDWAFLGYISSNIKSSLPTSSTSEMEPQLLDANLSRHTLPWQSTENSPQTYTAVSAEHIHNVLEHEFLIRQEFAYRFIFSHLRHISFFNSAKHWTQTSVKSTTAPNDIFIFSLPLGLDTSVDVEVLISAVESSLTDLDLTVNEFGLLLLVRRLLPNGMASEYSLQRLTNNVLSWILAEDDNLARILRDYVALQKPLPGVATAETAIWPIANASRTIPHVSVNNGGDYVIARRALQMKYAVHWLSILYRLDASAYVKYLYDACMNASKEETDDCTRLDRTLRCMIKLSQAFVTFDTFGLLFDRWLALVCECKAFYHTFPSLYRLVTRESDPSHRFSVLLENETRVATNMSNFDVWQAVFGFVDGSNQDKLRCLQGICVIARAGIDISGTVFMRCSSLIDTGDPPDNTLLLVTAIMTSVWLRAIGRQELQLVFSSLHSRLAGSFIESLKAGIYNGTIYSTIRLSLATCLLLYGCDRMKLIDLEMIREDEINQLPSRRKLNDRNSHAVDPVIIEQDILDALQFYITAGIPQLSSLISKFFAIFLTESPFMESYEIDNFILRNGKLLATCAWEFYNIQNPAVVSLRTSLLLRTIVVEVQPFHDVLRSWFDVTVPVTRRLVAVTRLFRIILDVNSPYFDVENRQWRSNVVDIFYFFFSAIWDDASDEVRLAANTLSSTLLPAHFEAISRCWDELLAKAPVMERIKLTTFLTQLRHHFPRWKVLSWTAITEALSDYSYGKDEYHPGKDHPLYDITSPVGLDTMHLRVSTLLLSLQMISDGIVTDDITLLKIKVQLAEIIGFEDVSMMPSSSKTLPLFRVNFGKISDVPDFSLPCIEELVAVFDAHYFLDISSWVSSGPGLSDIDNSISQILVGTGFVDVLVNLLSSDIDVVQLPILTSKSLLEALCIVIYKHNFETGILRHLQVPLRRAVDKTIEILSKDVSYEIRQLALSVVQAFVKTCHTFMGSTLHKSIEGVVHILKTSHTQGQDALVTQGKQFFQATLHTYWNQGLFIHLLKHPLEKHFFHTLKSLVILDKRRADTITLDLAEMLLRDTLLRLSDVDTSVYPNVVIGLCSYIQEVYYEGYSQDMIAFVGQHLTLIARRLSDFSVIDGSPLIVIPAILIQHNKKYAREILPYVETALRVALNRLDVSADCLKQLSLSISAVTRKPGLQESHIPMSNIVPTISHEILGDALRLKARVLPRTMRSMMEILKTEVINQNSRLKIVDGSFYFLGHLIWTELDTEEDFRTSVEVAKMIYRASQQDLTVVLQRLVEYGADRSRIPISSIRFWNVMVLAAIQEPKESWAKTMFTFLATFSDTYFSALKPNLQATSFTESAITDINHACISVKLWLMLAKVTSSDEQKRELATFAVWNELWPPFESLIYGIDNASHSGGTASTVLSSLSSSAINIIAHLRTLRVPLASLTSTHLNTITRLRGVNTGDSTTGKTVNHKLHRALHGLSEPAPDIASETLLEEAAKDIIAVEKLRALEMKREVVPERRGISERQRKEMRHVS